MMHIWAEKWPPRLLSGIAELYIVGGAVRDLEMGIVPKDFDLACPGPKQTAALIAARADATLVPMEKRPDQPCYRIVDRADTSNYIDISGLQGGSIHADLSRRDFTINAMAVSVNQDGMPGALVDPYGGRQDIEAKIIRMTTTSVFEDDPLRILRAYRFGLKPGFKVDAETRSAMKISAAGLTLVSPERIMSELLLILGSPDSTEAVRNMDELGLLDIVFPEILPMKGMLQNGYHHLDVWQHSLLVYRNLEAILRDPAGYFDTNAAGMLSLMETENLAALLKFSALFHDCGKPETKGMNEKTGRITFYGHDEKGAEIVARICERMRMSAKDRGFVLQAVREHLRPLHLFSDNASRTALMRWFRRLGDNVAASLVLSMADVMSSLGPDSGEDYREDFLVWCSRILSEYQDSAKKILEAPALVRGSDLIGLGMSEGPELGLILRKVREAQDIGEVSDREGALAMAKKLVGPGS